MLAYQRVLAGVPQADNSPLNTSLGPQDLLIIPDQNSFILPGISVIRLEDYR